MGESKPKYEPRPPRPIYAPRDAAGAEDKPPKSPAKRQAKAPAANKRATARKALAGAEKAAKPLSHPKPKKARARQKRDSKRVAVTGTGLPPNTTMSAEDSERLQQAVEANEKARKRAPGGGRKAKDYSKPWVAAGMSRSAWYRQQKAAGA